MDGWEAAIALLMSELDGGPGVKVNYLIRHHARPAEGLICWGCSQRGEPWPCAPILLAREAQFRLRLNIPQPREATP